MAYHVIVGLEMHCEMKSKTKVFSPASNQYVTSANTNVNEIDLGFPGILPTLNLECVKKAIMAAKILKCQIPKEMLFDRKNYYYPDLPKGYQITQNTMPVGIHGNIDVECNGIVKNITIQDIHLEEDSAALDHLDTMSLIDYNRAGVPLLECVTDPCITSAEEAVAFLDTMCKIYQYTDISDADTKKGQIRCDVNVNLQDDEGNFITPKVEIKNINSFANVKNAIIYEYERQSKALEDGKTSELIQETRRFDEETGTTVHMRSKVDAIDYKYFVEPNIPPFIIDESFIDKIASQIPVLALERKQKYINELGLDEASAKVIVKEKILADYFENCVNIGIDAKTAANWLNGSIISFLNKEEIAITDFYLKPEYLKQIVDALNEGTISSKQAKEIFNKSLEERKEPKVFISSENKQISDEKYIEEVIDNILANNKDNIIAYQNGKTNVFDFFVGMVMKETKGKANPVITKELLHKKIDKD